MRYITVNTFIIIHYFVFYDIDLKSWVLQGMKSVKTDMCVKGPQFLFFIPLLGSLISSAKISQVNELSALGLSIGKRTKGQFQSGRWHSSGAV